MGQALAQAAPQARAVWTETDEALGEPLSTLAWEGPAERLDLTENAQPAILAASVAIERMLRDGWVSAATGIPAPAVLAGHSMGQYSALVAARVIDLGDAVRLVRRRGQLMQAA